MKKALDYSKDRKKNWKNWDPEERKILERAIKAIQKFEKEKQIPINTRTLGRVMNGESYLQKESYFGRRFLLAEKPPSVD